MNEIEIELRRSLQQPATAEDTHARSRHDNRTSGVHVASGGAGRNSGVHVASGSSNSGSNFVHDGTAGRSGGGGLLYPELSYAIVGALIEVHRWMGPGQLESTYQQALEKELWLREIPFRAQVSIASRFKEWTVGDFVVDLVVDGRIVLELKAVSKVLPVHRAQLISYLRATGCRLGLLVNFHVPVMIQGIKRIAL